MNKNDQLDVVKNCKIFLYMIKDLEPYLLKFQEERSIKIKKYLNNYLVEENKHYFIIAIAHDEDIFFVNDEI